MRRFNVPTRMPRLGIGSAGLLLLVGGLWCIGNSPRGTGADASPPPRLLLVTGRDYPGHVWRETAPVLRQLLERNGRFTVSVIEDPHLLDSAALTNYDAVLLHFQNWQTAGPGEAARENLRRFVAGGGGLAAVHFACGAWFGEWPEFKQIIGRVWHGPVGSQHDPRGPFTVHITAQDHPVTRGLTDFETDDELYTCLTGEAPIQVLATARSKVDGKDHPLVWVREYGRGRVFVTTLGHDVRALTNSSVTSLLCHGCAWAARDAGRR